MDLKFQFLINSSNIISLLPKTKFSYIPITISKLKKQKLGLSSLFKSTSNAQPRPTRPFQRSPLFPRSASLFWTLMLCPRLSAYSIFSRTKTKREPTHIGRSVQGFKPPGKPQESYISRNFYGESPIFLPNLSPSLNWDFRGMGFVVALAFSFLCNELFFYQKQNNQCPCIWSMHLIIWNQIACTPGT